MELPELIMHNIRQISVFRQNQLNITVNRIDFFILNGMIDVLAGTP